MRSANVREGLPLAANHHRHDRIDNRWLVKQANPTLERLVKGYSKQLVARLVRKHALADIRDEHQHAPLGQDIASLPVQRGEERAVVVVEIQADLLARLGPVITPVKLRERERKTRLQLEARESVLQRAPYHAKISAPSEVERQDGAKPMVRLQGVVPGPNSGERVDKVEASEVTD